LTHTTIVKAGPVLDRTSVAALVRDLDSGLRAGSGPVTVDLEAVEKFDSAGLGGIVEGLRRAREQGAEVRLRGMSQAMRDLFSLVSVERLTLPSPRERALDPISRIGAAVEPLLDAIEAIGTTTVQTARAVFYDPFRGRGIRFDRTAQELDVAAAGALPIVALISFLLGLILAMQAFVQLRIWGAEIYMADMVGVSVMTEIGPLMTAIILAARSGSSNAAQLGSMVVSEEVDALRQMGVNPVRFLVVPKVLALAFSAVGLCVIFDVVAMCGGALFGYLVAGIELGAYQEQTRTALHVGDFLVATGKCLSFGTCVGIVGCALGMRVTGGSEGVGRATTNAVVLSVFLIIVVDAIFVSLQRMVLA